MLTLRINLNIFEVNFNNRTKFGTSKTEIQSPS